MSYAETIEPVTTLKTRCAELIERARETGEPIIITQNGKATAALVDIESFERQRESLLMLRALAEGNGELDAGKGVSHERVRERIARYTKKPRGG